MVELSDGWATVLVGMVMVVGLAGTIVPVLPGLTVLWGAALVYGLLVGFGAVGVTVMVLLTLIVVASVVKSVLLPRTMAEEHRVSRWSQLAAVVGAIVGFFAIPVVGVIVGALAGLLLGELVNHGQLRPAFESAKAVARGFGISALVDMGLGAVMISLWGLWAATVLL